MLEIRLVGPSPGTPHQRSYRESMSFTSLELETKSYTKILKNKKVRAENILGEERYLPPPNYERLRTGTLSNAALDFHSAMIAWA